MEQGERTRGDRAKRDAREWLPWLLLGAAALVGCTTLYAYSFADEGDSLWIGLLLSRGQRLYRDVFSHHFPFQDYWGAAVIAAFGKSILAVRLSVWGFQIAAFGIAMGLSRFHLPLALAALVWSVVRHLFLANLLLYPSFAGAALLVVLAIVLAVLMGRVRPDWRHSLAVGLFSTVAILSDPLSVYAVAIALAFLLLGDRKSGIAAGLWAGAGLLAFVIALAVSGSLQDFVRDAIVFNSDVLSRYLDVGPQRLAMLLDKVVTGLGIGEPRFMDWDPFKAISSSDFDFWAFSGLLFRLAVLVAAALLLVQKDYAAAGFLYLFSAAALLNRPWGFRAAGFVLVALLAASAVASGAWWKAGSRPVRGLRLAAGALVGVMVIWLGLRVAIHSYVQDPGNLSYERHFARHEVTAAEFQRLACGRQDVLLGFYPGPAYAHWFSELQPVAGYWLMYPWVAEVALDPVLETLAQDEVKAIVRVRAREVKGHDPQSYLRPLLDYLDQTYVPAGEGLYRSPALAAQCPPQ